MSLEVKAKELCGVLEAIVVGLESYDKDSRISYTKPMALKLRPLANAYREAVYSQKSRVAAKQVLDDLKDSMHNVNGAATKGEIDFVAGEVLDKYWELTTIFQESCHSDQQL
jgi:hypothetical protein